MKVKILFGEREYETSQMIAVYAENYPDSLIHEKGKQIANSLDRRKKKDRRLYDSYDIEEYEVIEHNG